jgi:hypothetical protein
MSGTFQELQGFHLRTLLTFVPFMSCIFRKSEKLTLSMDLNNLASRHEDVWGIWKYSSTILDLGRWR